MGDARLPEIQISGKKKVEQWLADNGYSNILKEALQSNEFGLIATGRVENILIQVRTFLHPNRPFKLSEYEVDQLIRRANKLQLKAYAAYVVLSDNGDLMGEINWERLS